MRKTLAAAAILAAIIAVGGWFSPQVGLKSAGGGSSGLTYGAITGSADGFNPVVYANSKLPFLHRVKLQYRYLPGVAALAAGNDTILLTTISHSFLDSALNVNKQVTLSSLEVFHGDSIYVNATVAALDSTVLSTNERGYLIEHPVWPESKAFFLVLTADDGHVGNMAWSAAADSLGIAYTIHPSLAQTEGIDKANMLTSAQLATVYGRGVEVGFTGNHHRAGGILAFAKTVATAPDSIVAYANPAQLGGTFWQINSYCYDLNYGSYQASALLDSLGYKSARTGRWDGDAFARGYDYTQPGNSAFDAAYPLKWYETSNIFGIACWLGENAAAPTTALFDTGAGSTLRDSIDVRLTRFRNQSARNEFAPIIIMLHSYTVTREDIENLIELARAHGDMYIGTQGEMAEWYRARHVPRDAPGWAPLAQCNNITAADEIFWGLPAVTPNGAATDSFLFHRQTTAVDTTAYPNRASDKIYWGKFNNADTDSVLPRTSDTQHTYRFAALPLSTDESMYFMSFNVDELDGLADEQIVEARIHFYVAMNSNPEDIRGVSGAEDNYYVVCGVTNPVLFEGINGDDASLLYSDTSTTTAWTTALTAFDEWSDFGKFIHSRYIYPGSTSGKMMNEDITDYIRYVVKNDLDSAGLLFSGTRLTAPSSYLIRGPAYSGNSTRPYLVVRTCE